MTRTQQLKMAGLGVGPFRQYRMTSLPALALKHVHDIANSAPARNLEQQADATRAIYELMRNPTQRGVLLRNYGTSLIRRTPPRELFANNATGQYLTGRDLNREAIAHEAFHLVPGLGQSESLTRFYGGWKAPSSQASWTDRLRSGANSLKSYWLQDAQPADYPGFRVGPMINRLFA